MEKTIIIALHGFLGLPKDWNNWHQTYAPDKPLLAVNLWEDPNLDSSHSLTDWTTRFLEFVQTYREQDFLVELWGYSMGGRLALGALLQEPLLFTKAVILSANPGLKQNSERASRWQRDQDWAQKFQTQDWASLMQEWHRQPVLQEPSPVDNSVDRRENQFSRDQLAQALVNWSIALQPNYWPRMAELPMKIEWHVGDFDHTYRAIGQDVCALNPNIQLTVHPNRGHRLIV